MINYVIIDIGSIECSEPTKIVAIETDEEKAKKIFRKYVKSKKAEEIKWNGHPDDENYNKFNEEGFYEICYNYDNRSHRIELHKVE